ncbi:metal-dependent hydrolase [Bacillota bacterium LX-D]|nr:metal-dependent hydrolase [Bacillota bacterium LX-D]
MKLVFHGHSCFEICLAQDNIIIDPWLNNNPQAKVRPEEINVSAVLVTHGHSDHLGDAIYIARNNNALLIAPFELASYCNNFGVRTHGMHIGGANRFSFGKVKLTQALHGSAVIEDKNIIYTGNPCGFILELEGKTVYHAGDTGLFGDMQLIGKNYNIDVALLPIGDNFTMGIDDAVQAVEFLRPKVVIPMHYNTFSLITQNVQEFVEKVKLCNCSEAIPLQSGNAFTL